MRIYIFISNCLESERFSTCETYELNALKYKLLTGIKFLGDIGAIGLKKKISANSGYVLAVKNEDLVIKLAW